MYDKANHNATAQSNGYEKERLVFILQNALAE